MKANHLESLPNSVVNLTKLRDLDLDHNYLTELPS